MNRRSRGIFLLWLAAFFGLFAFNGQAFAQTRPETFCYLFNFDNSDYASSLAVTGSYETDLGTGQSYYTSVDQGNGNHRIAFSYNPWFGIGFYGRITRTVVDISYPVDTVSSFPPARGDGPRLRPHHAARRHAGLQGRHLLRQG